MNPKLVFKKDDESQVNVFLNVDGREKDFSYVDMIKALIKSKKLDDSVISEGFTDAEIKSINSMVICINKEISSPEGDIDKAI